MQFKGTTLSPPPPHLEFKGWGAGVSMLAPPPLHDMILVLPSLCAGSHVLGDVLPTFLRSRNSRVFVLYDLLTAD